MRSSIDRAPAASLAGCCFALDPLLVLSGAASDRVKGAYHVIVAPLVARVTAEHGLTDWWAIPARGV